MSQSISNGLSVDIPVQATHSLKLAWLGGTYTARIISGAANLPVALATNSASSQTFGPYATAIMVRLTVSAIGRVAWDTASAPAFIPPGEQFTRQDDGIPVTLSGVGPAAAFAVDGDGIPRVRIASATGGWNSVGVTKSNGVVTSTSSRIGFRVNTDIRQPSFIFAGGFQDSSGLLNGVGNSVRFNAVLDATPQVLAVSLPHCTGIPVSSGGKPAHILPDGELVRSLPLGIQLNIGVDYNYRTHVSVDAGQFWPHILSSATYLALGANARTSSPTYGTTVTDGSDKTISFADSGGNFASTAYSFGAVAIIGEQVTPRAVCLVAGDSISAGSGDAGGRGYLVRALENSNIGYLNVGVGGITLQNLFRFGNVPQYLASFVDHVLMHCATNDLNGAATVATVKTRLLDVAKSFTSDSTKIWFATVLPRTTSTDTWATTANQAPTSWEALRVEINNWIRNPSGLMAEFSAILPGRIGGVFDPCTEVERGAAGESLALNASGQQALNTGGRWLATGVASYATSDGIHPTAAASVLASVKVPVVGLTI